MKIEEIKEKAIIICKDYRKANRLTQTELANLAGVSKRSILNIEHGVLVKDSTMQKVLKACGWVYEIEVRRGLRKEWECGNNAFSLPKS